MMDSERGEPLEHAAVGWDTRQLAVYFEALRKADERFQAERDRRYTEVRLEQEKALKIKEEADERALSLARENQKLRDDAHNELLNQWREDRSTFVTKDDQAAGLEKIETLIKPALEWVSGRRGRDAGSLSARELLFAVLGVLLLGAAILSPHIG
jgi:hypothetical protein